MNEKFVIAKLTLTEHFPGDGNKVEGLEYINPVDNKVSTDMLGYAISDFEKVKEIPSDFHYIDNDDYNTLLDIDGVNSEYSGDGYDPKHSVESSAFYVNDDKPDIEYRKFTLDAWSKFVYLFNKEHRMFYLTY